MQWSNHGGLVVDESLLRSGDLGTSQICSTGIEKGIDQIRDLAIL